MARLRFLHRFRRDPLGFYLRAWRQFGDIARLETGRSTFLVAHPDFVKHVLQDNRANYTTSLPAGRLQPLVGRGLGTSVGDDWQRQRRFLQPVFRPGRVVTFAPSIAEATVAMLARWPVRAPVNISEEMTTLNYTIMGRTLFGDAVGTTDALGALMRAAADHVDRRVLRLLDVPDWLGTPATRRFRRARARLGAAVRDAIGTARCKAGGSSILSMLVEAAAAKPDAAMTEELLEDEILTFVYAWHDTTSTALAWTWSLLGASREIQERLHAEVAAVLGGRTASAHDLPRLPYTRMIVEEALRLYPPLWANVQRADGHDEIGGHPIPAQSIVVLSPYITHRHPAYWEDPERFDPERFTAERAAARPRYAYFPFGGGPRLCIGNDLAMMEMQLVVATMAQHCALTAVPGPAPVPVVAPTLRPNRAVWMVPRARAAGGAAGSGERRLADERGTERRGYTK